MGKHNLKIVITGLILTAVYFGTFLAAYHYVHSRKAVESVVVPPQNLTAEITPPATTVYRYSITPGGVWDAKESGIPNARKEVLTEDLYAYVSYRRNGKVFWTLHPVKIGKGETIITNGTQMIRARCGNAISLRPEVPLEDIDISTLLDQPVPMQMDESKLRDFHSPLLLLLLPPTVLPPSTVDPPVQPYPPIGCCLYGPNPPGNPPVQTPEPASIILGALTGLFLGWIIFFRGQSKPKSHIDEHEPSPLKYHMEGDELTTCKKCGIASCYWDKWPCGKDEYL